MIGANEIVFIRETFGLSQRSLAKALNVSPHTVLRWESGSNGATGLQEEVLRGLHSTAVDVVSRPGAIDARMAIGGRIALGIGALIFYLLTQDNVKKNPGIICS